MNMLNFIRSKRKRDSRYSEAFFQKSYHQWIKSDQLVQRSFQLLIESITSHKEIDEQLEKYGPVAFIPANGKMACSVRGEKNMRFIVVFPDLLQMMKSADPIRALAVLSHELGHIYCNHHQRSERQSDQKPLTSLEAQIEADEFAAHLGFAKELQDVLLDVESEQGAFVETRVRIARLTSFLMSEDNNKTSEEI